MAWGLFHRLQVFISLPLPHDRKELPLFLLGGADDYASLSEFSAEEVLQVLHVTLAQLSEHDRFIVSSRG